MFKEDSHDHVFSQIEQLGTAIFYDLSDSVIRFPATVITVAKVERTGYIWFTLRTPFRNICNLQRSFFSRLKFFNRKYDYHITAEGIVFIDPNEALSDSIGNVSMPSDFIWVKMKIMKVEYFCGSRPGKSLSAGYLAKLKDWVLRNQARGKAGYQPGF